MLPFQADSQGISIKENVTCHGSKLPSEPESLLCPHIIEFETKTSLQVYPQDEYRRPSWAFSTIVQFSIRIVESLGPSPRHPPPCSAGTSISIPALKCWAITFLSILISDGTVAPASTLIWIPQALLIRRLPITSTDPPPSMRMPGFRDFL